MNEGVKSKALRWFIRNRSPDVDDREQQQFSAWLAQSDSHRAAYHGVEQEYRELDKLESWAAAELGRLEQQFQPPRPAPKKRIGYWLAGVSMAAAAALVFVLFPLLQGWGVDRYQTMPGEQRGIVLKDNSRVHLNSASLVAVAFTDKARQISLLQGEGLFDVAHEAQRPFIVQVRGSKIVAVGTRFSVYAKADEVTVTVLEGKVAVVPEQERVETADMTAIAEKASVLLEPDRRARVDKSGKVSQVEVVDATKVTAWDRGLLILDGIPLRQAAQEISRYIAGSIQIAQDVPDYPVTGIIKIRDQETMLKLLAEVVPVRPVKQSAQLTILYSSAEQAKPVAPQ